MLTGVKERTDVLVEMYLRLADLAIAEQSDL